MTQTRQIDELRHRVNAKRRRLQARLEEAKADANATADGTIRALQSKLDQLEDHVRDGWDDMTSGAIAKINDWLKDD